jgi:hypothetical protein
VQHRVEPVVLVRLIAAGDGIAKAHVSGAKVLLVLVAYDVEQSGAKQALKGRSRLAAAIDLNPQRILCPIVGNDMEPQIRDGREWGLRIR